MTKSVQTLRLILGDQLSYSISSLHNANKTHDVILIVEVMEEATYVKHHKKKIAFLFSAMRHFAEELTEQGFRVRYVKLDDPDNRGSFDKEVERAIHDLKPKKMVVTEPGEWRVLEKFKSWRKSFFIDVEIRSDNRFFCTLAEFKDWHTEAGNKRMEYFYRDMRRKHRIMVEADGKPMGGRWNYDTENRKPPPGILLKPTRPAHVHDAITKEVLALVADRFADHFGDLEPFRLAVDRKGALKDLHFFIDTMLVDFGQYQDAMLTGDAYLYHSVLSAYINAGLLLPREICELAEQAYINGDVPINAAEGFIRQILGWREFMRGVYWTRMPDYAELNFLNAKRKLPGFYWNADTDMHCMHEAITHTKEHAYSHHIQRLMVTGNFALIAGLDISEVCEWYLVVYQDAYEWVEMPNTLGMALFADGGVTGSKPYAASGKYIHKMSNFCESCLYNPNKMIGPDACPFNALYWDFLDRNDKKLRGNQRLYFTYKTWDRMADDKKTAIRKQAEHFLSNLKSDY